MSKLSRRSLVTSAAALPELAVPVAAVATCSADDARINALWAERTATAGELRGLHREIEEAESKLPEWARPGPKYLRSDGTYGGEDVGWPLIQGGRTPEDGVINKRPSPDDIRETFEIHVRHRGEDVWQRVKDAQKVYEKSMAELNERLRLQRIEKERVGLAGCDERQEALCDRSNDIDDAIEAMPATAAKAAAMFMIAMLRNNPGNADTLRGDGSDGDGDGLGSIAGHILPVLRPQLTGLIAHHVDDLIDNPSTPNDRREWW
jgi:hypothetical protein